MAAAPERRWRPLLRGPQRDQALEATADIARRLESGRRRRSGDASLAGGSAGLGVLFGYLAKREPNKRGLAARFLGAAIDTVASRRMDASLYGGFTGIAWAVEHVGRSTGADDAGDANEEIDRALLALLARSRWPGEYDLISGLVGLGVYALERLPRPSAVESLARIVGHLERKAIETREGVTWLSRGADYPASLRKEYPRRFHNLGLAHGVAGVIGLLGAICAAGVGLAKARPLLGSAVSWLLAQKLAEDSPSAFPCWVVVGENQPPARSAWCYGDPGIAMSLLLAARGAGRPAWEAEALAMARRVAARPFEEAGAGDAGLCHGAAGLGHIFNRIFQATGDASLGAAARAWFERALGMRRPGRGIGGFQASLPRGGRRVWGNDPGLLSGSAGIALALLSAATDVEPEWDRFLLLSMRDR